MAIEIVDLPFNSMVIFHSYVKLPEGRNHTLTGKKIISSNPWQGLSLFPSHVSCFGNLPMLIDWLFLASSAFFLTARHRPALKVQDEGVAPGTGLRQGLTLPTAVCVMAQTAPIYKMC